MDKVAIKTDNKNRIRVRGELIVGDTEGLIADVGSGFFVVTKEAHEALIKLGIEMQVVELVKVTNINIKVRGSKGSVNDGID